MLVMCCVKAFLYIVVVPSSLPHSVLCAQEPDVTAWAKVLLAAGEHLT